MVTGWLRNAEPFRRTLPCTWTGSGVRAMGINVRSWIGDDDGIGWSAYPVAVTTPPYVRFANNGMRNSPVAFVVKTRFAPWSSVKVMRAPAIASPEFTAPLRFRSR